MKALTVLGEWNGVRIRCNPADEGYIRANDMAKSYGKQWSDFRRLEVTQRYIEAWTSRGIPRDPIITVRTGANEQRGTWIHRRLAIRFAQWLNEEFALWIDERIEELMMRGHTSLKPADDRHLDVLDKCQRTLDRVEDALQDNRQTQELCWQTLKQLQHVSIVRLECEVERQLQKEIGGMRQVPVKKGTWKIDLLTETHVIEVKHYKEWKKAVGQLLTVSRYVDQDPRAHFFWRPFDKPPTKRERNRIEKELSHHGIEVTWHEWPLPLGDHQELLW